MGKWLQFFFSNSFYSSLSGLTRLGGTEALVVKSFVHPLMAEHKQDLEDEDRKARGGNHHDGNRTREKNAGKPLCF